MATNALRDKYAAELEDRKQFISRTQEAVLVEDRDLSELESESLSDAIARVEELANLVRRLDEIDAVRDSAADISIRQQRMVAETRTDRALDMDREPMLGDFVDSDAYRGWKGGRSDSHIIKRTVSALRAPLTEGAAPGSALLPTKAKFVLPQPEAPNGLLDVVTRLPVSSNAIELVTYGAPTGATGAAVVAEGAAKPEAQIAATVTTATVDTLAFWIQATRQLLQDAPAARALIDDQLRRGLVTKVIAELGAAVAGATYTATTGAAKAPLIEVARQGMATVQAAGWTPNAIVCSPLDAAGFDLALYQKTTLGASFGANVWGLEVIPVAGYTGAPLLGDFKTGVTLLERTGVEVYISDSHADTFIKNVFTILAETRVKAVVTNPTAITKLVVTP